MANVVKWGADKPKKAIPDGFFDYTYEHSIEATVNRAWTYDAKLSERMDAGYDFPQSEKRKAVEYMTNAAINIRLKKYLGKPGFTGHLLISNKFKESDIPRIQEYVFTQAPHLQGRVVVSFMDAEALLELSEWVDLHSDEIRSRPNVFLNKLDMILQREPSHITLEKVQKLLASVLKEETERDPLDLDKLANEIAK